jgi:hypothetical protein
LTGEKKEAMVVHKENDRNDGVKNGTETGACHHEWGQVRCQQVQIGDDGSSNGEGGIG